MKPADLTPIFAAIERAHGKVEKAHAQVEAELKRLDAKRLRPEALAADSRAIRSNAAAALANDLRDLGEARATLEKIAPRFDPERLRLRARFDPDPIKNSTIGAFELRRVAAADEVELSVIAEEAEETGSLALAVAIEREARRRNLPAETRAKLHETTRRVPLPPDAAEAAKAIRSAMSKADFAASRARELESGARDPRARLNLAFSA